MTVETRSGMTPGQYEIGHYEAEGLLIEAWLCLNHSRTKSRMPPYSSCSCGRNDTATFAVFRCDTDCRSRPSLTYWRSRLRVLARCDAMRLMAAVRRISVIDFRMRSAAISRRSAAGLRAAQSQSARGVERFRQGNDAAGVAAVVPPGIKFVAVGL